MIRVAARETFIDGRRYLAVPAGPTCLLPLAALAERCAAQSPLHQSYGYRLALAHYLGVHQDLVQSIVCFIGKAKLQNRAGFDPNVVYQSELVEGLEGFTSRAFTDTEVRANEERLHELLRPEVQSRLKLLHEEGLDENGASKLVASLRIFDT